MEKDLNNLENINIIMEIDLSKFIGEWVVICDDVVIDHNKDISKLEESIRGCRRTPTIAKIPVQDTLIFYGFNL